MKCAVIWLSSLVMVTALLPMQSQARGLASTRSAAAPLATKPVTRHVDMVYVTLTRIATEKSIETYNVPAAGNVYLTLWLSAVNRNDVPLDLATSDFKVILSGGASVDAAYTTLAPALPSTVLNVGGHTAGTVTFEVPQHGHAVDLEWAATACSYDLHWTPATWPVRY